MKKLSKSLLQSFVLLSILPLASAFASTSEDENDNGAGFCGKDGREVKIKLLPPHKVSSKLGEEHTWTIVNLSNRPALEITAHSDLVEVSQNNCFKLPGKRTCEIVTRAVNTGSGEIVFEGCNTKEVKGHITVNGGDYLSINSDTCFRIEYNQDKIELFNGGEETITFKSSDVQFEGLEDVRVGYHSGDDFCRRTLDGTWSVLAGRSCYLPLEARQNAHNLSAEDGQIKINYLYGAEESFQAEGCLNVATAEVEINDGEPIQVPSGNYDNMGIKHVRIKNNSHYFNWQNPDVFFDPGTTQGLDVDIFNCNDGPIGPGESCEAKFFTTESDARGKGELFATGSNIYPDPASEEVWVGDVTITLGPADDQHLQYQKIRVSNNFAEGGVYVDSVTFSNNLAGDLRVCKRFEPDSSCRSTCSIDDPSKPIEPNSWCDIYVKTLSSNNETLKVKEGTVYVKVVSDYHTKKEWNAEFRAERDTSLYVTGLFNRAGITSLEANNIVKWNGKEWRQLSTGLRHGEGRALAIYQGDLHVGGKFQTADNVPNTRNMAKWNGKMWMQLGEAPYLTPNKAVNALLVNNEELNLGGEFTTVNGMATPHVAVWDGVSWMALGGLNNNGTNGPVYDLISKNDGIYMAGDFRRVDIPPRDDGRRSVSAHNVAGFVNLAWVQLGNFALNGVNRTAYGLHSTNDNDLFVVGDFKRAFGLQFRGPDQDPAFAPWLRSHYIAEWTGNKWVRVGSNQHVIHGPIFDITSFNNTLFIGGNFHNRINFGPRLRYVAYLNSNGKWRQAGININGTVKNLYPHGNRLYAGGRFSRNQLNNIAYKDIADANDGNWNPIDISGGGLTSTFGIRDRNPAIVKSMLVADGLTLHQKHEEE